MPHQYRAIQQFQTTPLSLGRLLCLSLFGAILVGCGPTVGQCRRLSEVQLSARDNFAQIQMVRLVNPTTSQASIDAQMTIHDQIATLWEQAATTVEELKLSGRELKTLQAQFVVDYQMAASLSRQAIADLSNTGKVSEAVQIEMAEIDLLGDPLDVESLQTMRQICARL